MKAKDDMVVHLSQLTGYKPKMAGLAKLEFYTPGKSTWLLPKPTREGDIINIPNQGYDLVQLLPDFSQFLLIGKRIAGNDDTSCRCFFGGTDERPFLVEIYSDSVCHCHKGDKTWLNLWRSGEFYDELKPPLIKKLESKYGNKTKRQGDIFAFPLPVASWEEALVFFGDIGGRTAVPDYPHSIFGTRHSFTGGLIYTLDEDEGDIAVGTGAIKAPDHKDLVLNEVYILAQTYNLAHPEMAD